MRIFSGLYNKALLWSAHRHAPYYLAGVSFIESTMFFIPPDVMLASMSIANPPRAWFYAALTTVSSVLGGIVGYMLGASFLYLIMPYLISWGFDDEFNLIQLWFHDWGFWAVIAGGMTPFVPYKLFTITAGAMHMHFLPFIVASLISRGARFFLEAAALRYFGERIRLSLHRYIDYAGWIVISLLLIAYLIYHLW
jgi:membrane protein YqaA with SNARE-associated domain